MEELNNLVGLFLKQSTAKNPIDFIFTDRLADIIIKNKLDYKNKKTSKLDLKKSIKYTKDFLFDLNEEYATLFEKLNPEFIYDYNPLEQSYTDLLDNKLVAYIAYEKTIRDIFTITHEFIHLTTIQEYISIARNVFCEALSLASEMYAKDYLDSIGIKNTNYNDIKNLIDLDKIAVVNKFQTLLLIEHLNTNYITLKRYLDFFDGFDSYIDIIVEHIKDNIENKDFDILFQDRYVIGYPIACYIHELLDKKGFIELNEMINYYGIEDFLDYLELEYKNNTYLDLTDDSYDKIEKSFKKYIKRI